MTKVSEIKKQLEARIQAIETRLQSLNEYFEEIKPVLERHKDEDIK